MLKPNPKWDDTPSWYGDPNLAPGVTTQDKAGDLIPDKRAWQDCLGCLTPWFGSQALRSCSVCANWPKTKRESVKEHIRAKRKGIPRYQYAKIRALGPAPIAGLKGVVL